MLRWTTRNLESADSLMRDDYRLKSIELSFVGVI